MTDTTRARIAFGGIVAASAVLAVALGLASLPEVAKVGGIVAVTVIGSAVAATVVVRMVGQP